MADPCAAKGGFASDTIQWRASQWESECGRYLLIEVHTEKYPPYAYALDRRHPGYAYVPGAEAGLLLTLDQVIDAVELHKAGEL